jgi:hypothetical protein
VQPSQTTRNPTQVVEARKKRKYVMEYPIITLTEDDAKFIMDKVQDRGKR